MADAIWPWLRNWHSKFYSYGDGDPKNIASAIKQKIKLLDGLRDRTIDTLSPADDPIIRGLFWSFTIATGRTNKKGVQGTPVGAAKVLHSLSPSFLPLWDDSISDYYDCERDGEGFGYTKFCRIAKQPAKVVEPYVNKPDDQTVLKRIDEFLYAKLQQRVAGI
jgi:hypothetical protein